MRFTLVALLLAAGCASQPTGDHSCNMTSTHVCPEEGHGPCPFCPSEEVPRYQVRIVNPSVNELLHTTDEFNDAYEYVVEYSSAHADLVIYDLETGKQFEETP